MAKEARGKSSPEERTEAFFVAEVEVLTEELLGMTITLPNTDRMVMVQDAQAWGKEENTAKRYKPLHLLEPGELFICRFPLRGINQSLVVAKSDGQVGGCARLVRVNYFDRDRREFVESIKKGDTEFSQKEGDIARYFGLEQDEIVKLAFLDDTENLFLIRTGRKITAEEVEGDDNFDADAALRKLLK